MMPPNLDELQSAAESALESYRETSTLCRAKLERYRSEAAAVNPDVDPDAPVVDHAQLGRVTWLSCMLLSTSDEALRTSHALMRVREQHTVDQLAAARADAERAEEAGRHARAMAEQLRTQIGEAAERSRRHALESHQQRNRDAGRLRELQAQVAKLQEASRMAESSWKEDRRAELAAAAQREKNFSSAILRLQKDLEAARGQADASKYVQLCIFR